MANRDRQMCSGTQGKGAVVAAGICGTFKIFEPILVSSLNITVI